MAMAVWPSATAEAASPKPAWAIPKAACAPPRQKNPARPSRARVENPAPPFGKWRAPRRYRRCVADSDPEEVFHVAGIAVALGRQPLLKVFVWRQRNGAAIRRRQHARRRIHPRICSSSGSAACRSPVAKKTSLSYRAHQSFCRVPRKDSVRRSQSFRKTAQAAYSQSRDGRTHESYGH